MTTNLTDLENRIQTLEESNNYDDLKTKLGFNSIPEGKNIQGEITAISELINDEETGILTRLTAAEAGGGSSGDSVDYVKDHVGGIIYLHNFLKEESDPAVYNSSMKGRVRLKENNTLAVDTIGVYTYSNSDYSDEEITELYQDYESILNIDAMLDNNAFYLSMFQAKESGETVSKFLVQCSTTLLPIITVEGKLTIQDNSGNPINDATLEIQNSQAEIIECDISIENGVYTILFPRVIQRGYTVLVTKEGYQSDQVSFYSPSFSDASITLKPIGSSDSGPIK